MYVAAWNVVSKQYVSEILLLNLRAIASHIDQAEASCATGLSPSSYPFYSPGPTPTFFQTLGGPSLVIVLTLMIYMSKTPGRSPKAIHGTSLRLSGLAISLFLFNRRIDCQNQSRGKIVEQLKRDDETTEAHELWTPIPTSGTRHEAT